MAVACLIFMVLQSECWTWLRYSEEPAAEDSTLLNGSKESADPVTASTADAQQAITEVTRYCSFHE